MNEQENQESEPQEQKFQEQISQEQQAQDDPNEGFVTDATKFKETLDSLINQICFVRHPQVGNFAGQLKTDGTGFGFPGGIGFLVDSVEKIYPITVPLEKNMVRGVVYLKEN